MKFESAAVYAGKEVPPQPRDQNCQRAKTAREESNQENTPAMKTNFQQVAIADLVRIESDAHDFHMPRIPVAHLAISRLIGASAHVAGLDMDYARETLKNRFDAPEASAAENRCLLFGHDD